MTTTDHPLATIPLNVGGQTFALNPTVGARFIASALSPPPTETNLEAVERIVGTIAGMLADERQRPEFVALWDTVGQGDLLDVWEQVVEHYTRRPTDGPSPYSRGFGTPATGTTSTPASPSPVAPASVPSQPTSDG